MAVGRPVKQFENFVAERTKTQNSRCVNITECRQNIVYTAEVAVRISGKRDSANIIKEVAFF